MLRGALVLCPAALMEALETLAEDLDQLTAAKQQVLQRAEAAEKELESIKAERSQTAMVSAPLCLSLPMWVYWHQTSHGDVQYSTLLFGLHSLFPSCILLVRTV